MIKSEGLSFPQLTLRTQGIFSRERTNWRHLPLDHNLAGPQRAAGQLIAVFMFLSAGRRGPACASFVLLRHLIPLFRMDAKRDSKDLSFPCLNDSSPAPRFIEPSVATKIEKVPPGRAGFPSSERPDF